MSEINKRIKVHDTVIDFVAHKIYIQVEGTELLNGRLSEKQAMLLQLFVRNFPSNTTRQEIMAELWPNGFISPESVNQIINKTRKAIRDIHKDKIVNDPGKGYRLGDLEFLALTPAQETVLNKNEPSLYSVEENIDVAGLLQNDSATSIAAEALAEQTRSGKEKNCRLVDASNSPQNETANNSVGQGTGIDSAEIGLSQTEHSTAGYSTTSCSDLDLSEMEKSIGDKPIIESIALDDSEPTKSLATKNSAAETNTRQNRDSGTEQRVDEQAHTPQRRVTDQANPPKRRASDKQKTTAFDRCRAVFFRRNHKLSDVKFDKSVYLACVLITLVNFGFMAKGLYKWVHSSQFLYGIEKQPSSRFMQSYDEATKTLKGRTFKGEYFECVIDVREKDSICRTVD